MNEISIDKYLELTPELLNLISDLDARVFSAPLSKEVIFKELEGRKGMLALTAKVEETVCAYKIGFEYSPGIFYSWIGGVDPNYRRRGIARALMTEQHSVLKELGYKYVRTSTKNKYREMLLLNIKAGFDVTGVQKKLRETEHSIILEKEL